LGNFFWSAPGGTIIQNWLSLGWSSVVDFECVTVGEEMFAHGDPHYACTDPTYFHNFKNAIIE